MSIIDNAYETISHLFLLEKTSFKQKRKRMDNMSFTSIKWSSSYMDFFPYDSAINQLKPAVIYKGERKTSIKNCYVDDKLLYACHNERENWGSLFIEYDDQCKKSLLFVGDDIQNMALQQLKIAYFQNHRYDRVLSYIKAESDETESLFIDLFEYDNEANIIKMIRQGFFGERSKVMPMRTFNFVYQDNQVRIFTKDLLGKDVLIHEGKKRP